MPPAALVARRASGDATDASALASGACGAGGGGNLPAGADVDRGEPPPDLEVRAGLTAVSWSGAGDDERVTTISPNGDGLRDAARIRFTLSERARVRFEVTRTVSAPQTIYELTANLRPGRNTFT